MAGPFHAEAAIETTLAPSPGGVSALRVRVEDFPWADPWARVTTALANAVPVLAQE